MKEAQIVVIDHAWRDDYDNIFFADKEGVEHKVGNKRPEAVRNLVLENPGKAVKLTYKRFQQYDYIDAVELVSDEIKETPEAETPQRLANAEKAPPTPTPAPTRESGQQQGMMTKEVGEWLRLGYKEDGTLKLSDIVGTDNAVEIARWYRREMYGVLKINHDGAKFPFIKKEGE